MNDFKVVADYAEKCHNEANCTYDKGQSYVVHVNMVVDLVYYHKYVFIRPIDRDITVDLTKPVPMPTRRPITPPIPSIAPSATPIASPKPIRINLNAYHD